jgi:dTDP-4-dehydrorhamnose reductase
MSPMKIRSILFYDNKPDYCINASAYTAVDLAETEKEKAFAVNAEGLLILLRLVKMLKQFYPRFYRLCF